AGFTPLVRADRLAAELGLGELWIKNDTLNPTGSFKDRVVAVALAKARELGFKVAACASTGNLANAVAASAARSGMRSIVFIAYGSQLTKIDKGFKEMATVGLIEEHQVRVSGAQAAGCSPVATAFAEGSDNIRPVKPSTIAKSLAIGNPADGFYALDAVRSSG